MALLLWSGGTDSTLLLYDLLAAKYSHDDKKRGQYVELKAGDKIRTISIYHPQQAGYIENHKARQHLLPILRKKYDFPHGEISISQDGIDIAPGGMPQPMIWLLQASQYLEKDEDLYAGYVEGDQVWHYRASLVYAFQYVQEFTHRTGKLVLPLEWTTKSEVLYNLQKLRLLNHTWHCELPVEGKRCKHCPSCTNHDTALWRLKQGIETYKPIGDKDA
jgi:hypothetical protein